MKQKQIDSNNINQKLIYDDEYSIKNQQKNNILNKVLKYLLIVISLVFITTLLIFSEKTLFANKMLLSNSLNSFFDFSSPRNQQLNFLIIYRFLILSFVLFYSLVKGFANLYWHKVTIKKYIPFYFLYLLLSLTSYTLFFSYFKILPSKLFTISFILIALYIINFSYEIFNFLIQRKTNPLLYKNKNILIISLTFQGILTILFVAISFVWINLGINKDILFVGNKFYETIRDILTIKSASNFVIIVLTFLVLITFIVLSNIKFFALLINKKYDKFYLKNQLLFLLVLFGAVFIWILRIFAYKHNNENISIGSSKATWIYIFQSVFAIVVFIVYMVVSFQKRFEMKSSFRSWLNLAIFQIVLALSLLLTTLFNTNSIVSLINVAVTATTQIVILFVFVKQNKNISLLLLIIIKLAIISSILIFAIIGFNYILTADGNENYLFSIIKSRMNIIQIILLLNFSIAFIMALSLLLKFILAIYYIRKLNKENEYEKERQ